MANLLSTTVNGQLNTGNVIDLGYTVNGSIATTEFRGINFHAFSDLNYYIGKPAGAWTQPLHIHFYTGIWLRSHHSYGGTRFYNIATGTQLMSVGDGGDAINVYRKITSSISSGTIFSHASMDDAIGWNSSYGTYIGSTVGGTYYIYGNGRFYDNGTIRTLIHSGNIGTQSVSYASSAGNADTVDNYHASGLLRSDGGNWNPGANITLYQTGNGQEWSFDIYRQGYTGGYWHVWDSSHGTMLGVDATNNYVYATGSFRAPIFYDSADTGYYLDPNGTSNLLQLTTATRARWNMPRVWYDRSSRTSDQGYWTGTNGWGAEDGTWANAWKGGFSGWDIWGYDTDHPQGAGNIHAQGIVSGQHYATSGVGYGWMMVGANGALANRYWLRGKWDTTTSSWVEMITTGNIGSQNVALLQGYSAYSLIENSRGTHSGSDFPNGTLVTTDINASEWAGASFVMEVSGKSYSSQSPFKLIMQGYLYADTIINVSAMSYGSYFPAPVKVMNLNGNLAFWWPRGSYWNSFEVHVRDAGGSGWNRVTGIDNSVDPEEATKKVSCTPIQVLHTNTSTINTTDVNATNFRVSNAVYFGGGNNYLNWTNNRIYSNVGIEAPIFYDANDTGFYLDPNGSSRISYVYTDQVYTYGWFRNYGTQGMYNQDYGTHFYSNAGNTWVVTGSGGTVSLEFRSNHQSTLRGYVYADTSNNIGFLNNAGNWSLRTDSSRNTEIYGSLQVNSGTSFSGNTSWFGGYGGGSGPGIALENLSTFARFAFWGLDFYDWNNGIQMTIDNGYVSAANSFRAPIFYDSNDTSYYLDPNSSSQLSSVYANNWFRPQGNSGLYFQSYGYGIWSAESGGSSYGNVSTYTSGRNSWPGYAIGDDACFMARDIRKGIYLPPQSGWLIRWESADNMAHVDFELQWGSDIRHKSNIKRLTNSLDKVKQLKGVSYNYKGNERTSIGFIAQEVEPILPEVVSTDGDGFKSVGYANIVALLSEAIKEQQVMIDELRAEIDALKSK